MSFNRFRVTTVGVFVSAAVILIACAQTAYAQSTIDLFDQSQGGSIASASPTIGGFDPIGLIGGATTGEGNAGNTIFSDSNTQPNFVQISTTNLITINRVELFNSQDGASASRGISLFSLFADTDNNGTFETTLIGGVDPVDTGSGANIYSFAGVTARSFRAQFTGNTSVTFPGSRIIELDAFSTPVIVPEAEASTLSGLGLASLAIMIHRRRRSGK
ncbi:MAG: hypothetical protein H7145_03580 [Akkermansiaceae bacterium]|nr:hypothetical protein [Armatimonadota bacterium]